MGWEWDNGNGNGGNPFWAGCACPPVPGMMGMMGWDTGTGMGMG